MILQNTLDLSTFEIIRFRIWNQTSNPDDYGIGTKYFNTNSGHDGYNRENIYTDTGWRKTAYLDDIEAITNGEGSLGTRVKALEDMLNVDSAETVVSTWEEIQAFLDNVKEGTDLMTMLDGKLDKTGGTINGIVTFGGNKYVQIKPYSATSNGGGWANKGLIYINGDDEEIGGISAFGNNEALNYIFIGAEAYNGVNLRIGKNLLRWGDNAILHSGNVGEYKAGGLLQKSVTDLNSVEFGTFFRGSRDALNMPTDASGYLTGICLATDDNPIYRVVFGLDYDGKIFSRAEKNGVWSDWKAIAFTDSDITGRAAGFCVVKNKNGFNLNTDLQGGGIVSNYNDTSWWLNKPQGMLYGSVVEFASGSYESSSYLSGQLAWDIRNTENDSTGRLWWRANDSRSYEYAKWHQIAFTDSSITGYSAGLRHSNGTVGLIVDVNGYLEATQSMRNATDGWYLGAISKALGNDLEGGMLYSYSKPLYFGNRGAVRMLINPSGNATIGSSDLASLHSNCKFYVDGRTIISSNLSSNAWVSDTAQIKVNAKGTDYFAGFAVTSDGQAVIQGGHANVGAIPILINPSGGAVNVGGNLAPNANNSLSLGTSTYRWSNVYSTLGDFNGAVTIRSNADGAELLRFATDRPWKFSQIGTGAATNLCLSPDQTSKSFVIADSDTSNVFEFWINGSNSSATFNSSLAVAKLATFNAGALIPTGQKLTFGEGGPTMEYDATNNAIKVTGNLYTTGTLASGGKAKEGTGTGSGSANVRDFELPADGKTKYDCDHLLKSKNVIVQVFEKAIQNNIEVWEMILTDVTIVTEDRVTVTFGRPTNKVHKVHIIGGNVS